MTSPSYVITSAPLPDWNCNLTLIFAAEGVYAVLHEMCAVLGRAALSMAGANCVYAVLHEMCAVLGLANASDQATRLKNHPLTAVHITDRFSVRDKPGGRKPYCLHIDGISKWLMLINPNKVRPEFRSGLLNFQVAVFDAANRILYGMTHDANRKILHLTERLDKADVVIPEDDE